eukprot:SAG31_NODE_998_length_10460_cov_255.143505_9_plen_141_part_00
MKSISKGLTVPFDAAVYRDVAMADDGTLFVADGSLDPGAGRIRWLCPCPSNAYAGITERVVGTVGGLPSLSDPRGLAILPSGQLVVADHEQNMLWCVDLAGSRRRRLLGAAQRLGKRSYFLVFVQLFEKHGTLIERYIRH